MNIKFLYALLCALLFINCAHSNKIELSEIETRLQLDSVIALMSEDSVRIDSLPQRELHITLDGDFTLYGVQVDQVSFVLIKEELASLTVTGYAGFKTVLTNIENSNGLGLYQYKTFSWDILHRQMELRNRYNSPDNLLEISDDNDFTFECIYYPHSKNAITDLVTNSSTAKFGYYLRFSNYHESSLEAELWLNGFKVAEGESINKFLVPGGKQELKMKMLSDKSRKHIESLRKSDEVVFVNLLKKGKGIEQVEGFELISAKEQAFSFNIDVPQTYPKRTVDLREIPDIKERLYQCYEKLYNAFLTKDEVTAVEIMLPYFRAKALAYNYDKKQMHQTWRIFDRLVTDVRRVRLVDKSKLDISFTEDGTLATLKAKEGDVLSVRSKEYDMEFYTFYFYEDETGEIKICF